MLNTGARDATVCSLRWEWEVRSLESPFSIFVVPKDTVIDVEGKVRGAVKITFSTVFAGQNVGIKEVSDRIWLVTFMHYDLGFFDYETRRLEPVDNPFEPKVLPMCPV